MAKMDEFKGDKARFLPKKTYKNTLTMAPARNRSTCTFVGRGTKALYDELTK